MGRCQCSGCGGFDKYKAEHGAREFTDMVNKRAAAEAYYLGTFLVRKRLEARDGAPDPEPALAVSEAESILNASRNASV